MQWLARNGPAIWGGCVTRRKHRAGSWYFSQKAVTVQGGYGALFAVQVQILPKHYECRGTELIRETDLSNCNKCYKMALVQCRGTSCPGTRIL